MNQLTDSIERLFVYESILRALVPALVIVTMIGSVPL